MNYAQWKLQFKNLNLRIKRKKIARYKWRSIGEVDKWVYFERASSDLILFRIPIFVSNPLAYIRGKSFILSKSCKGWVKLVSEGLVKRKFSKTRV